jgi:hypothetical protein
MRVPVIFVHVHDPLPLPRPSAPPLPKHLQQVISKGLAKDPADRFVTAADMVRALAAVPG